MNQFFTSYGNTKKFISGSKLIVKCNIINYNKIYTNHYFELYNNKKYFSVNLNKINLKPYFVHAPEKKNV